MIEKKLDLFLKYKLRLIELNYNVTNDNLYFAIDLEIYKNNGDDFDRHYPIISNFYSSRLPDEPKYNLKLDVPYSINSNVSYGYCSRKYEDYNEDFHDMLDCIIKTPDTMDYIRKLIFQWVSELYEKIKEDENYKNKVVNYIENGWYDKPYEKVILYDIKDKYGTKYGNFCLLDLNYKLITDF